MRTRTSLRLAIAAVAATAPMAATAEQTISQPILELRYSGDWDFAYFAGAARWGAPSCPNALYAQITASVPGRRQLLAVALAAKAGGSKVTFVGACDTDPRYFNVTYIVVGS